MASLPNPGVTWLLFCRQRFLKGRLDWTCVCGTKQIEAELALSNPSGYYSLMADGMLLGTNFKLEARSRSRLEGDTRDSHVPLFVGSFEHQGGVSGDFTIRPRPDGELMTLGVYGACPSIRVVKLWPNRTESPLEVHGISNVDICFERFGEAWHTPSIAKDAIPAEPGWQFYSGRCITAQRTSEADGAPPMLSVLITMTIVYHQLLLQHYMRSGD